MWMDNILSYQEIRDLSIYLALNLLFVTSIKVGGLFKKNSYNLKSD